MLRMACSSVNAADRLTNVRFADDLILFEKYLREVEEMTALLVEKFVLGLW